MLGANILNLGVGKEREDIEFLGERNLCPNKKAENNRSRRKEQSPFAVVYKTFEPAGDSR